MVNYLQLVNVFLSPPLRVIQGELLTPPEITLVRENPG